MGVSVGIMFGLVTALAFTTFGCGALLIAIVVNDVIE